MNLETNIVLGTMIAVVVGSIIWRHGLNPQYKTTVHGMIVLAAALAVSQSYFAVQSQLQRPLTFLEEYWVSLPLLTSFTITNRCIFGRIFRSVIRTRKHR